MEDPTISNWIVDLMVILAAGLLSGLLCKRLGVSLLVGYLIVGAVIGGGALQLVTQEHHEIEWVARTGALLLLFSIGMEFSLGELRRLSRYFFLGGSVQMLLAALPLIVMLPLLGWNWKAALMIGAATSLSSTVLVFKTLAESGQLEAPHGRRAIAILLFQDVALVPLMLLLPMLTGEGSTGVVDIVRLAASTVLFLSGVMAVRYVITAFVAPLLARLRSVELLVLFSLSVLGLGIGGAQLAGLPPALGALAAGLGMGGNRLSGQVDAIILPFRESFAAVFFVGLGTLLRPAIFLEQPLILLAGLLGALVIKTLAGGAALRCTGLDWLAALGMGLGLAQMGEFSFVLFSEAMRLQLISAQDYNRMLFIALGTLIATPELLRLGLRWSVNPTGIQQEGHVNHEHLKAPAAVAVIIGGGRLGRHAAEELRQRGYDVRVIDTSPVNLHRFAQAGFQTTSGDARAVSVLKRVSIERAGLVMVFVSHDRATLQIAEAVRERNVAASLLVRCRYHDNIEGLKHAGCNVVICDEAEATQAIAQLLSSLNLAGTSLPEHPNAARDIPTEADVMSNQTAIEPARQNVGVRLNDIDEQRADPTIRGSLASAPLGEVVTMMSKLVEVGSALFKKHHPEVGARPGTLVIADDAPPPKIRMISYDLDDVQEREIHTAEELSAAFDQGNVTWVDVQGFGDEPLIREIGDIFSIHPLAMEDIVNMPQRPKAEAYEGQVLIITRMVRMKDSANVDMEQVTLVLGENYVLTLQERYGDILDSVRQRIRAGKGRPIRRNGAGYLAYAIVDTIVDGYYPVIEALGDHLEQLENVVMEQPSVEVLRVLNGTKNMLVNLRRAIWPQREAVNSLIRDENPLISDEVRLFLRDTYDHCVQTAEVIEMYREMSTGLMNTYLSSIANRTNEVMKVLTIMASVFIPLTFLAGIYGMNFEHMPELNVWWAYPLVWTTMLMVGLGMLGFFWRKGWIGKSGGTRP